MQASIDCLSDFRIGLFGQKPEAVVSTPYQRFKSENREDYYINNGFYQTSRDHSTHPIIELSKNEQFKKILTWRGSYCVSLPPLSKNQEAVAVQVFIEIASLLNDLYATKVVFERTPEDSLFIKAGLTAKGNLSFQLFLAIYFDETEPKGYEAILNIFHQKEQVMATSGEFGNIKVRLHGFFSTFQTPQTTV